jgi:hypothetical protein
VSLRRRSFDGRAEEVDLARHIMTDPLGVLADCSLERAQVIGRARYAK